MNSRERINNIINKQTTSKCGFWLGKPQAETIEMLNDALGTSGLEEIQIRFSDDIRWITPQYFKTTYSHPDGISMRPWKDVNPHGLTGKGLLSSATKIEELESVDFPESRYLDFEETATALDKVPGCYILSGFWSPFYHDLTYLFGTEELMIKMYTDPEIVKESAKRICNFYLEANELFFKQFSDKVDALFIGNDFGTQNGLMFSPQLFNEFFLPWIKLFAAQAHSFDLHIILHSCGSVADIIPELIDIGLDCLHPMQTTAKGMSPSELSEKYRGKITFMGGIDTQDLLLNGSTDEIDAAVEELLNNFGTGFILGPSHEALLPTINVENVIRMAEHRRESNSV